MNYHEASPTIQLNHRKERKVVGEKKRETESGVAETREWMFNFMSSAKLMLCYARDDRSSSNAILKVSSLRTLGWGRMQRCRMRTFISFINYFGE